MIPQGVRGDKRGKYQVELMKLRFRELLSQLKSNKEIMKELALKKRTFYRYKTIIIQEDRILWQKIMHNGEFR
jgi:DNA invertase Pin-like site-specific DNA recombinase